MPRPGRVTYNGRRRPQPQLRPKPTKKVKQSKSPRENSGYRPRLIDFAKQYPNTAAFHEEFYFSVHATLHEQSEIDFQNEADDFFATSDESQKTFEKTMDEFVKAEEEITNEVNDFFALSAKELMKMDEEVDRFRFRMAGEKFEEDADEFFAESWKKTDERKRRRSEQVDRLMLILGKFGAETNEDGSIEESPTRFERKAKTIGLHNEKTVDHLKKKTSLIVCLRLGEKWLGMLLDFGSFYARTLASFIGTGLDELESCSADDEEGPIEGYPETALHSVGSSIANLKRTDEATLEFFVAEVFDEVSNGNFPVTFLTSPKQSKIVEDGFRSTETEQVDAESSTQRSDRTGPGLIFGDDESESEVDGLQTPDGSSDEEDWWDTMSITNATTPAQ